jgi:hypothetical protein
MRHPGFSIIDTIWSLESYRRMSDSFLFQDNHYIECIIENISDDKSFVEYIVPFHDRSFYDMWFREQEENYIPYREQAFADLRSLGVEIKTYIPDLSAPGVSSEFSLDSEFITSFPERVLTRFGVSK